MGKIHTRMGAGIRIEMSEAELREDLEKGTTDAADRAKVPALTEDELQYLFEINKVTDNSDIIVADLENRIGLRICDKDFNAIVSEALRISWTRDHFDRVIVANASLNDSILISKDQGILGNYQYTIW